VNRIFVSLGSNVGDRLAYLQAAVDAIETLPRTRVSALSAVYITEPVGKSDQPDFLNLVAELSSDLGARELFSAFKEIEKRIGRTASERWGPREIDLDLLYYGDAVIEELDLRIPHPERANRRFVLIPLVEIAPEVVDPVYHTVVQELLRRCPSSSAVQKTTLTIHRQHVES